MSLRYEFKLFIFLSLILFMNCAFIKYKKKIGSTEIQYVHLENVKDGVYEGFYNVYYLNARVKVKVENKRIVDIQLIEHKHDRYSGEPMIKKVMETQSLDVETITGATNSCKTVLKAIELALNQGIK